MGDPNRKGIRMAVKPGVLLAGAAFVGALAYGGVQLASAQTSNNTPSQENPAPSTTPNNSTAPNGYPMPDNAHCPHMGSNGSNGTNGSTDTSPSFAPNAESSI